VAFQTTNVGGVPTVGHGGSWVGQLSSFRLVESRDFAVIVLTNGHRGAELHGRATNAALREHLGIESVRAEHVARTEAQLRACEGTYKAVLDDVQLSLRDGSLVLDVVRRLDLMDWRPRPPMPPPTRLAFTAEDRVIGLDEPSRGARGELLRSPDGQIEWLRWGGRIRKRL
jgi:hypothetical protein